MLTTKAKRTGGTNSNAFKSKTLNLDLRTAFVIHNSKKLLDTQLSTNFNLVCLECCLPLNLYGERQFAARYLCNKHGDEFGGMR